MRIVEAPAQSQHAAPGMGAGEPVGWSPDAVDPTPSTRGHGLLLGALSAWRGVPEAAAGAALTQVQVDAFAPFLSTRLGLDAAQVRADLERVRVQVGGLADGVPNMATTVGPNIYVADAGFATRMLSWGGRNWLAHELVHTMQWRRLGAGLPTDAQRDRRFLNHYVGNFVAKDGSVSNGGFAQALGELLRRRRDDVPVGGFGDLLHDTHPLEREAILVAADFAAAHPA
ncbi:MAG: hypothetical protein JWN72_1230 [Thermoleophilia bacterium]|nr:hypothetical protein [Thermoleophilia bacterium]